MKFCSGMGSQFIGTGGSQDTDTHSPGQPGQPVQLDISSQALNSGQLIGEIKRLRERYILFVS